MIVIVFIVLFVFGFMYGFMQDTGYPWYKRAFGCAITLAFFPIMIPLIIITDSLWFRDYCEKHYPKFHKWMG